MRRIASICLILVLLGLQSVVAQSVAPPGAVWLLKLEGVVGPATADYLVRGMAQAHEAAGQAVVLRINTPGGLDSAMREMISAVLASPIPVICHVAPGGARAASAGTFLLYSCHVAAMAQATNLGAATPVSLGGPLSPDPPNKDQGTDEVADEEQQQAAPVKSAMERKVTNDAVAYIRSLAELRGRNAEWAEKAVREGASLTAGDALRQGVIDLMAEDTDELLAALQGRSLTIGDKTLTLQLASAPRYTLNPDWRSEFLAVITNPNVAYVLMLLGIYGLIFEFSNPGVGIAGVVGVTCLLIALYAFQILPISYAGLALILLGVGLIVAEALMPSFGVLGIGGVIAFVVGSIMLMDTEMPAFQIALPLIGAVAVISGLVLFATIGMAMRAHRRPRVFGVESGIGQCVTIEQITPQQVLARYEGELWSVRCPQSLEVGDRVRVESVDGLTLVVDKLED